MRGYRFLTMILLVSIGLALGGCTVKNTTTAGQTQELDVDGNTVVGITENMTDRFTVSGKAEEIRLTEGAKVLVADRTARIEEAKARQAEAAANPQPQIIINDAASLESYERIRQTELLGKAYELMAQNTTVMAEAMKAMAGDKGDMEMFLKQFTLPKGVVAESLDSFFDGGAKLTHEVGNAPATMILSTGKAAQWVAKEVKQNITATDGANVNTGQGDQKIGLDGTEVKEVVKEAKAEPEVVEESAEEVAAE